jgi:hypothetical protein
MTKRTLSAIGLEISGLDLSHATAGAGGTVTWAR